ncbi:solute carrier family 23 member 1-like isoform X3 [Tachypleus tridentatus]|uniref:solute carrier family 23 member 1-like isoform X3 n=1 Tax=Tachypleus tridentatus TaxID=6853 RepID=UPI003FCF2FD4
MKPTQKLMKYRLPIIQDSSSAFLAPIFAILSLPQWKCPSEEEMLSATEEELQEIWQLRMREVLLTIIAAWVFCAILTAAGAPGPTNAAKTDLSVQTMYSSP